jgi:hypothetical protein
LKSRQGEPASKVILDHYQIRINCPRELTMEAEPSRARETAELVRRIAALEALVESLTDDNVILLAKNAEHLRTLECLSRLNRPYL